MYPKSIIIYFTLFSLIGFMLLSEVHAAAQLKDPASHDNMRGEWMIGNWGVRVVLPAGEMPELYAFDPKKLVSQIVQIRTIKWVMINLTQGAYGGRYTAPNKILERQVDAEMAPQRDLFGETARLLKKAGLRVLVYFASEGPSAENLYRYQRHSPAKVKLVREAVPIRRAWSSYIKIQGLTSDEAVAKVCIEYYSKRYGLLIDGWWFDHGRWGNASRYIKAARVGNEKAVVAWNEKHRYVPVKLAGAIEDVKVWGLCRSSQAEDYTAGHITPTKTIPPWSKENEIIIHQIEKGNLKERAQTDGLIAHLFLPIQATWRGGKAHFPTQLAIDWTTRIIQAKGAITWAVALSAPEYLMSRMASKQFRQLLAVDAALLEAGMQPR